MSELAFSSTHDGAPAASPLARALHGADGIRDLSLLGKLEVRRAHVESAPPGSELIRIAPTRSLVTCAIERRAEVRDALPGLVVDVSSALAGIEVSGEQLMRRLTDLDLEALPAAGKIAGVPAFAFRDGHAFRIFFAQELGDSVVELVRDVQKGLA
jgi:hypothetical protein